MRPTPRKKKQLKKISAAIGGAKKLPNSVRPISANLPILHVPARGSRGEQRKKNREKNHFFKILFF
jgi:hypothetical protein